MHNPQYLPTKKDLHIRHLSFPQPSVLKSRYTDRLWRSADPLQSPQCSSCMSQCVFLGEGLHLSPNSRRESAPLCHSHTPRQGPSRPCAHERRQASAAEQPGQAHARWGSRVQVRLHKYMDLVGKVFKNHRAHPMSLEQKDEDSPTWTEGLPITLSQLEMFCVSNLFLPGRASKAETTAIPPAQTDTRSHTAGFVATWLTGPELEAWLSGLLPLTRTNS